MIRAAEFKNFKGLRDVKVGLERLTVFVGPNSSGKTSILQGLHLLSRVRDKAPAQLFRGDFDPALLLTRGVEAQLDLAAWAEEGGCKLRVLWADSSTPFVGRVSADGKNAWTFHLMQGNSPERPDWVGMQDIAGWRRRLPASTFLRLDTRSLAAPSYSATRKPTMEEDGGGLASALLYLYINQPEAFAQVKDTVRAVFPFLVNIRFDRVEVQQREGARWGEQILFDLQGATSIPARLASDGLLLLLGLATVIQDAEPSHLILVDDLDHGLHPEAQRGLIDLLKKLLEEKPDLQILATTHSPYLLDRLRPDEVRLTTRAADGSVVCGRMIDHPDFPRWKEVMSPGEFWSMVGESWMANGVLQEAPA